MYFKKICVMCSNGFQLVSIPKTKPQIKFEHKIFLKVRKKEKSEKISIKKKT